ncbi:MAG: tail fiber assembly protein [Candidatus Phlomobacter fragariae]
MDNLSVQSMPFTLYLPNNSSNYPLIKLLTLNCVTDSQAMKAAKIEEANQKKLQLIDEAEVKITLLERKVRQYLIGLFMVMPMTTK